MTTHSVQLKDDLKSLIELNVAEIAPAVVHIHAKIPQKVGTALLEQARNALRRYVSVPGFRPGRAPDIVLDHKYKEAIFQGVLEESMELLEKRLNESYPFSWTRTGIDLKLPSEPEKISSLGSFEIEFKAEFIPDFPWPDFSTLKVTIEKQTFREELIDTQLQRLRENRAQYQNIDQEGKVELYDMVQISFQPLDHEDVIQRIQEKDQRLVKQEKGWVYVGEPAYLPGLNEILIGMKMGETKESVIHFPEDYANEVLKGQSITYRFSVEQIRRRVLPELNDAFAQQLGVNTLDELRRQIREEIEQDLRSQYERAKEEALLKELMSHIPEFAIGPQTLSSVVEETKMTQRQRNPPQPNESEEEYNKRVIEPAVKEAINQLRRWLVIQKLYRDQKFQVDQQDLMNRVNMFLNYRRYQWLFRGKGANPPKLTEEEARQIQYQAYQDAQYHQVIRFLSEKIKIEEVEKSA